MQTDEQQEIAKTIIQQLGGQNRLKLMVSGWNFCCENNGVSFRFKGSKIANYVKITLAANDTYTLEFMLINPDKGLCDKKETFPHIYNEMLQETFQSYTKLTLSL